MAQVTLIGEKLAEKDKEFIYLGPINECRNCKLKTVCFNLKPNRHYKIIKVRDKKHDCNVFEDCAVVVEVQELPIITTLDKKLSIGSKTLIDKKDCKSIGCQNYYLCNNLSLKKDKKYKITKIFGKSIDCPMGYNLQKVELKE
jgi:uncharacterized protein (UPF0179 family)